MDTRFTRFSVHSYSNLGVRVVHCLLSSGICRALSATVSASSFRGFPQCALILTMNVQAPRMTLARRHSMIVLMMTALASPASVVRGPLPIHLDTLVKVVSLSHRYSRSVPVDVACSVRANAASSGRIELTPSFSRPTLTSRCLPCCWKQTLPAPIPPLWADPSPAHVSPEKS